MSKQVIKRKTSKPQSKKPTGLTLTRDGYKFTGTWKCGDNDYHGGQWFSTDNAIDSQSIELPNTTMRSYAFYPFGTANGKLYPFTTTKKDKIGFKIKGKRAVYEKQSKKKKGDTITITITTCKPKYSDNEAIYYTIKPPNKPTASVVRSENDPNLATFSWAVSGAGAKDATWFSRIQYQAVLIKDCNVTDGTKIDWNDSTDRRSGTGNASGSVNIQEASATLAKGSYTRWFRVRAQGPAGDSAWTYIKYVYAIPNAAAISTATAKAATATTYSGSCYWKTNIDAAHPLTYSTVQYAIATPTAINIPPLDPGWQDVVTVKGTTDGGASFTIDSKAGTDQMMWYRVVNKYDTRQREGGQKPAAYGVLAEPSGVNVEPNQTTYRATITAQNNSQVPGTFLVVNYKSTSNPKGFDIGVIPAGQSSVTVQCPNWSRESKVYFGVRAVQGSYKVSGATQGVSTYAVTATMQSSTVWNGGEVPKYPTNITLARTSIADTIRVTWKWTWQEASSAEISWSNHDDAWESTDEPQTYRISNLHASAWNITGLTTGETWYVRIRLIVTNGDAETYGPWSPIQSIDLASAPAIPVMVLSEGVITETGSVTASWVYVTTDGTYQAYAEIAEVTTSGGGNSYRKIAETKTAQHITLDASTLGWAAGETRQLAVRVVSASGKQCDDWSVPVAVTIAAPLEVAVTASSLEEQTIDERTVLSLTELPLSVTIEGAGNSGTTSLVIERAETYRLDRPDERNVTSFAGEAIVVYSQMGEDEIIIDKEQLLGPLDDGAAYTLIATVMDGLGQQAEERIDFEVHWDHQALIPEATVTMDGTAAVITPIAPAGAEEGDKVDIYRLSADLPELIVEGGEFGETYVDPYPAIGEFGGHRVVFRSKDGDYITADNDLAWIDLDSGNGDYLYKISSLLDFDGGQIECLYDSSQSNSWSKDFKETKYLGGKIRGDWNEGVSMKSQLDTAVVTTEDEETIKLMRRIGGYAGICHLRTVDGTSYPCDIQISEKRNYDKGTVRGEYSINAVRVEAQDLDGMTLEEWEAMNSEE